jgi:hypothetical protein
MIEPTFAPLAHDARVSKLENDVAEIFGEGLAGQTFYIFKDKCARLYLTDNSGGFRKKISPVIHRPMFPPNGKRLAGRPA